MNVSFRLDIATRKTLGLVVAQSARQKPITLLTLTWFLRLCKRCKATVTIFASKIQTSEHVGSNNPYQNAIRDDTKVSRHSTFSMLLLVVTLRHAV